MSEKDRKIVDEAFATVRKTHIDDILDNPPVGPNAHTYSHTFGDYSESRTDNGGDGKDVVLRDSINHDGVQGASIERKQVRDKVDRKPGDNYESFRTDTQLTLPTTTGKAEYSSSTFTDTSDRQVDPETKIVRRDKDGNEVYRFTSKNQDIADKVGVVAAKKIVDAIEDSPLEKAA
jgi:hypothetical protein